MKNKLISVILTGGKSSRMNYLNKSFLKINDQFFIEKIIDSFGGIEICVDQTQREGYSFEIQKGCNILNGEIALNWVVSRNTEVLDGEKRIDEEGNDISRWKPMQGVSDLTRVRKQQEVILSLMNNLNDFDSIKNCDWLLYDKFNILFLGIPFSLSQEVSYEVQ